jgi:hypothetical protein
MGNFWATSRDLKLPLSILLCSAQVITLVDHLRHFRFPVNRPELKRAKRAKRANGTQESSEERRH